MDDYLLEVLEQQEEKPESGEAERIKNLLEETMALSDRKAHGTEPVKREAAHEPSGQSLRTGAQREKTQTGITRRILTEMEPLTYWRSAGRSERAVGADETGKESGGRYFMTFSEESAGGYGAGMGPEALSLFFERDARRYS